MQSPYPMRFRNNRNSHIHTLFEISNTHQCTCYVVQSSVFLLFFLTATSCLLFLHVSHRYLITLFMLYVTILYDIEHDISCINIAMYFGYSLKEKWISVKKLMIVFNFISGKRFIISHNYSLYLSVVFDPTWLLLKIMTL